ncbi:nuclear transport factor 2 family protein [Niveispirillum sp. KHB5.9]|uniref:nuclear transport factor 2 family protein n=1 Tax=Niveispirillum sp. KHB5.9 TaxID=3400269 RepID=UPI003A881A21
MTDHPILHPSVARSLGIWHTMVASRDLSALRSITHPDAIFRSPVAFTAYRGADALVLAIGTVIQVFQDFTYHRTAVTGDGLNVVLEFSASVEGKALKGIDFIRFDEEGRILEFEVMVRPLNGLQALALEMGRRVGQEISAFKAVP